MNERAALSSIELFTGAGGLALGLAKAGFHHLAVIEWDKHSCATLDANRELLDLDPSWAIKPTDVHDVNWATFADRVDLLAGGVPCQPFSLGGQHRGHADTRNLFPQMLRAIRELRPRAVLIENVKGLLRPSFRPYFEYVIRQIEMPELAPHDLEMWTDHDVRLVEAKTTYARGGGLKYQVERALIQAADYGVPQTRERVFIVAYRADVDARWRPPLIDAAGRGLLHSEDALLYRQYVTGEYWDEHGLRRPARAPIRYARRVADLASRLLAPQEPRWRTVRDALRGLAKPLNGRPHPEIDDHVGNPGARKYPGHDGSVLDWPAKTLKAGVHGVPGGENTLRYPNGEVRYFTAREAARLQTFPDEYRFKSSWGESFRQLGNAVPVELARIIGDQIAEVLSAAADRSEAAVERARVSV